METGKKHIALKILLAILPTLIFTQNYAWITLNSKLGWAFLIIWSLMVWSVWQFTEKNYIFERLFRLTEISFFLLPISAILFAFVLGAKVISSTTNEFAQAGAAAGIAIGGTFAVIIAFIIGVIGGIIMHLVASKYDKKAEQSGIIQPETMANKHGIILSLVGVIALTILFGSIFLSSEKESKDNTEIKSGDKTVIETKDNDNSASQPEKAKEVDLEITKKTFFDGDFQDQIQMDLNFTNKTEKNIRGVQGTLTFYDIFDNEIKTINVSYDQGIPAGQSKTWNSGTSYNQFIDEDKKLKDTELKDLKYKWVVNKVIYDDGSGSSSSQIEQTEKVGLEITQKGFHKANIMSNDFQDKITMEIKFTNKTDKNIKGVEGSLNFYDIFDKEIKKVSIAYDKGISASQSKVWNSGIEYNQFINEDVKLKDAELKDLKYKWELKTIVYEDGNKETF